MLRRRLSSTRTVTLFPDLTLFRSFQAAGRRLSARVIIVPAPCSVLMNFGRIGSSRGSHRLVCSAHTTSDARLSRGASRNSIGNLPGRGGFLPSAYPRSDRKTGARRLSESGRASWWERVCQYVYSTAVDVAVTKKNNRTIIPPHTTQTI